MKSINEELLSAWLSVSTSIINTRVVNELPYNEALVCNVLYENSCCENNQPLTATDLCNKTNMLKSQMNRTLNLLENKGIISRQRSEVDKRQVHIIFDIKTAGAYRSQHQRILQLLDEIIAQLGPEKTQDVIKTLNDVANIANYIINEKQGELL